MVEWEWDAFTLPRYLLLYESQRGRQARDQTTMNAWTASSAHSLHHIPHTRTILFLVDVIYVGQHKHKRPDWSVGVGWRVGMLDAQSLIVGVGLTRRRYDSAAAESLPIIILTTVLLLASINHITTRPLLLSKSSQLSSHTLKRVPAIRSLCISLHMLLQSGESIVYTVVWSFFCMI